MKPKTLIYSGLFVLLIIGLLASGNAAKGGTASVQGVSSRAQKSALMAPLVFHDFGTISMKNGNVTKEFTVTNPTAEAITVETVFTSCMCTTAFLVGPDGTTKGPFRMPGMGYVPPANETIPAGENRTVRVVYNPNAHGPAGVGRIDRFVTLTDDSGGTLVYEIKANVTP
ncbi:hypothetical protein A3A42_03330 [Candidatus Kaiserbacteria bacterium RIFCSPLOWO2_01_FULL_55_25]|nr:MAG: hypothetical protein A3A42_03330 [Candidatus Kaiserbacteria bacterium RIFCSPLOWO2_01_FULL_55_25]